MLLLKEYTTHTGLKLELSSESEDMDGPVIYFVSLTGDKVKGLYEGTDRERAETMYEAEVAHYMQRAIDEA